MNFFSIFLWSLLGILAVLLVVGFLTTMFSSPERLFDLLGITKGEPSRKYQTLKFLGIGMGGVLVALQALISYRRAEAMEKAANAQADGVLETEQGRRQERLKNAIEHLGNEKGSVRLGGAYELFHLAQDTQELRQTVQELRQTVQELRQTVLDILCAYVRQTTSGDEYRKKHKAKPSEEVQSMLTLLFVQEHEVFKNCPINLQGSWLNGISLAGARLAEADLSQACLQGAKLMFARLQGANLWKAQLQGAELVGAQLQGAELWGAWLQGADLAGTQLQGANLMDAQLQGANLWKAQLQGVGSHLTPDVSFENRIRGRTGKHSDLSRVVFAGGLSQEDIDSRVKGLSDEHARQLREKLTPHLDKPLSHEPPDGAVIGAYTAEEAEQWIAEYQQAMSEVPKAEAD